MEGLSKQTNILSDGPTRGVNHEMFAIPWMVLPRNQLFPGRQSQTGNVHDSRLHAASMLLSVRAHDLDFDGTNLYRVCYFNPSIPSELKWIDRVRDHRSTNSKIVLRDCVGGAVTCIVESLVNHARSTDGLLDRIDAQMHRSDLTSQFPSYSRLPCAW
jgi:hypothetical protein